MQPSPDMFISLTNEARDRVAMQVAEYLDTQQAARLLGISPSTLEKSRCTREGAWAQIQWCKIGRRVLYRRKDIDKAVATFRVLSISGETDDVR